MTVTLELSVEQERQLRDGANRRDEATMRSVLHEAVDATVRRLLETPPGQPDLDQLARLLDRLAQDGLGYPILMDDALTRAAIYDDHP